MLLLESLQTPSTFHQFLNHSAGFLYVKAYILLLLVYHAFNGLGPLKLSGTGLKQSPNDQD